jgi:NAD(P)-dependent dehydrogenase (short-subunit alcohol dehydrogenase family)
VAIAADLGSPDATAEMAAEARRALGGIDGLIHTTGGFAMAPAHQLDMALYDRMLDLNLRTLVVAVGAVLPALIEQGRGFLAAFAAGPAWHRSGGAGMSVYVAAKAAVTGYMHAVQEETGPHGISTAVVYPMGVVDTPANRAAMPEADPAEWIDPQEIGRALLFAATRGPRGRLGELPIFPPG